MTASVRKSCQIWPNPPPFKGLNIKIPIIIPIPYSRQGGGYKSRVYIGLKPVRRSLAITWSRLLLGFLAWREVQGLGLRVES